MKPIVSRPCLMQPSLWPFTAHDLTGGKDPNLYLLSNNCMFPVRQHQTRLQHMWLHACSVNECKGSMSMADCTTPDIAAAPGGKPSMLQDAIKQSVVNCRLSSVIQCVRMASHLTGLLLTHACRRTCKLATQMQAWALSECVTG